MATMREEWIARAKAARIEDELACRGIRLAGKNERVGPCPVCGGTDRFAINIKKQLFNCRRCQKGGDVIAMVQLLDGVGFDPAVEKLAREPPPKPNGKGNRQAPGPKLKPQGRPETQETYAYTDESGVLAFNVERVVFRLPNGELELKNGKPWKTFRQYRRDPDDPKFFVMGVMAGEYMRAGPAANWYQFEDEKWPKLPATRQRKTITSACVIPYRLQELLEAIANDQLIHVVEGEAKVDALAEWGIVATCNAGGAGKWTAEHAAYLRGANVVIAPDNDDPGRRWRDSVGNSLQGIAARVRVLELPGLGPSEDIKDWMAAGHTREEFDALDEQAADWKPKEKKSDRQQQQTLAVSAKELNTMRFEPIKYVVPAIIVEGLTLLAGKPKIGKSWMLLHAAVAVARGGFTLGDIQCPEGDVLYCALEDNLRRLQSRMTKLLGSQEWPARLFFRCELPRLAQGGLARIKSWIEQANHPRLVIIDTLAMVRSPRKRDESTYDADYAAVSELRTLANERGIAIVLAHHVRKQEADDAFDTVSGTLGLTGAPDSILVLRRDSSGSIVLHGRGRDLIEIEKAVTFNPVTCIWTIAGEVKDVRTSNERKTILAVMREIELPASPSNIASAAGMANGNVRKLLQKMVEDGMLTKAQYGKYDLASPHEQA